MATKTSETPEQTLTDTATSAPPTTVPPDAARRRLPHAVQLGLPLGVIALLYWSTFTELVKIWEFDPNYSHGYLVPLLSGFFVWRAWKRAGGPIQESVLSGQVVLGVATIVVGFSLHLLSWFLQHLLYDVLSLVCVLIGFLILVGGRPAVRRYGFAAFFLIFMAPLPIAWHQPLALAMQNLAAALSSFVLVSLGVPVYREGYFLHLPGYTAEVGAACSGLGQITVFLMLTVAAGHLGQRAMWSRLALIASSFPIALFANTLRIVVTGLIAISVGPQWTEGTFHTLEGVVVAAIGLVLVYLANLLFARLEQVGDRGPSTPSPAVST